MSEPDELYTLRAQYWLGHYNLAIQEAKSVARRPMSIALKAEREEFLIRAYTALGQYDKITNTDTIGLQAWALKAQYEAADGNATKQASIIDQLKVLAGQDYNSTNSSATLAAAQVLVQENQIAPAYQLLGNSNGLEHLATKLQILLKIDRLDLAKQVYQQLRTQDEDSIVTQLASVYIHLAEGRSGASDADHTVTALTEQYGASSLLLNLTAAALLTLGNYAAAEIKLQDAVTDTDNNGKVAADTYINLITSYVHQNKYDQAAQIITTLQNTYPNHPYCTAYDRTNTAFDREAIKYKV